MAKVLADEAYSDLAPIVAKLRAGVLNGVGHTTRGGQPWNHNQVKRVLDRLA
ncbi:MAG TPA: hypothetical protein VKP69_12225 [Isosphaeraceae bacterium]|jgi:hypothetical protein|nr:hypothetical protein [Isosphaeraceae bacterium]